MPVIYVPRTFGGTLIINATAVINPVVPPVVPPVTPSVATTIVHSRDGKSTLKTRSGSTLKERG